MGRGVNREDKSQGMEILVVRVLDTGMGAEMLLREEMTLAKEWRVTGRETTPFVLLSINRIALELSQIQPISLSFDLPMCNLDKRTKAAGIRTRLKYITHRVNSVPMPDEYITDARLEWS